MMPRHPTPQTPHSATEARELLARTRGTIEERKGELERLHTVQVQYERDLYELEKTEAHRQLMQRTDEARAKTVEYDPMNNTVDSRKEAMDRVESALSEALALAEGMRQGRIAALKASGFSSDDKRRDLMEKHAIDLEEAASGARVAILRLRIEMTR